MSFCLPKEFANKFVTALKEGKIVPEKMSEMTSVERRTYLEDIVGKDDAREVNALFESKLLLKDQKRGLVSWAKQVAGISEPVRRDLVSRIEKLDKVLTPAEEKTFLEDLAAKKLGTDVSFDEAQKIADLSKQVQEAKLKLNKDDSIGSETRLDYGAKRVALQNEVAELKLSNKAKTIKEHITDAKTQPLSSFKGLVQTIAGVSKGLKASFDNSFAGRQGFKSIFTNPQIWAKNFLQSFDYIRRQVGAKATDNTVMDGIKADVYSRPNALNGNYQKMKLDIGIDTEEAYPSALPERIPGIGRLYKASEVAYNGMAMRLRADIADQVLGIAEKNNVDLTDERELRSIGRLVNSLTGRGDLAKFGLTGDAAKNINVLFFSPKSLASTWDFLTLHAGDDMSVFARKQAATNLIKVAAGVAVILATAKALDPKSVDFDPRSSDFGKIKAGDTRFDITGGMSSLVTLGARLFTLSSKSSTTGKITKLNSGKFGAQTATDVALDFLSNKLAPAPSVIKDLLKGQTFAGDKSTFASEAKDLLVPLPITNIQELLSDPNGANVIIAEMADAFGIATNTYSPKKK